MKHIGLAGLLVFFLGCASPPPAADLVLRGGKVWTGAAQQDGLLSSIAIADGKIVALGSERQVLARRGPGTRVIELEGRFVMPGFIDNHTHFVEGGFQLLGLDLHACRSRAEFVERLTRYAASLPEGSWVTGGDWDHQSWPGAPLPRREWIDRGTARTPVLVHRMDGHMALANSRALELAGIDASTPDPPGGLIVRDREGRPTGLLKDAAMDLVRRVIPAPGPQETKKAIRTAMREANRLGLTTVNAMLSRQDLQWLEEMEKAGELTLRFYAILPLPEWQDLVSAGIRAGQGTDFLRIGALKGFMDGSLGSSTAWFHEPYSDDPSSHGLPAAMWFPQGNMWRLIEGADGAGFPLAIHAIGDRANDELLDLYQRLERKHPGRDRRPRIEHAQHLSRSAISRFEELGVIASMQPYHAIDDGRWAEKKIGPERILTTYAFRSLIEAGALVTFGSDWTVAPLNPLLGVYAAVTRRTLDGKNPGGWVPQEKITVEQALVCYTRNNARAIFAEDRLGTLEPGKLADLVVLSESPFEVDPARIAEIRVAYTIVNGRIVYPGQEPPR